MKIGILTASRTNNFGTDLQAYAMQRLFNQYFDAEIIDYVCPKLERSHQLMTRFSVIDLIRVPWAIYKNISHYLFRKKYFKKSNTYTAENLHTVDYDAVVVGSDQVWNLDITGNDLNFFIPFDGVKKYSYAVSIGKTNITPWQETYDLKKYLDDFLAISVRESSGVEVLKDLGVKASHHLDPLLMLDKSEWEELATYKTPQKYVFVYLIQANDLAMDYAIKYAKTNNLKIVVYQKPGKFKKDRKKCVYCNAERWLSYMNNADMIITNSYHGLSMAVALEKNFRVFGIKNSVQNNSRMENLVERLSLSSYMYVDKVDNNTDCPNWEDVRKVLEAERKKSVEYIRNIAKDGQ